MKKKKKSRNSTTLEKQANVKTRILCKNFKYWRLRKINCKMRGWEKLKTPRTEGCEMSNARMGG
jgi:hypothetical protein